MNIQQQMLLQLKTCSPAHLHSCCVVTVFMKNVQSGVFKAVEHKPLGFIRLKDFFLVSSN